MRHLKYALTLGLLLVSTLTMAQITRISGTVSDDFDVLPGAQIQEIDASNRTVNAAITDMNGNFVMTIKSPKNKLKVSYVGFKPQILPINRNSFKIKLEDATKQMKTLEVKAKKVMKTSGLAIPEREVSFSAQGIDAKEFEGLGITSVDEALQGRIAGLDIIANSGDLGSGTTMRLRGVSTVSTLTSNEPLIVVNGNIRNDVDLTTFDVSTANEDRFAELLKVNPEDIQDIKVLKDAAATAIWGSQGANGVIEITTKRGSRGPVRVNYSTRFKFTHQPAGIKLLNGDQYTMLLKESYFNPRQDPTAANIPELNYDENFSEYQMYNRNTDWVELVHQNGLEQSHFVDVVGGGEKATFRISGGFNHNTGSIIKQGFNRFSTRMALDYGVNDRILILSNFSFTYTKNKRNSDGLQGIGYTKMPNLSPWEYDRQGNPTGEYYYMLQSASSVFDGNQKNVANPLASAALAKNHLTNYAITPELELQYKLLGIDDSKTQLNYNGRAVIDISNNYTDTDYPRALSTASYINTHNTGNSSSKSFAFTTTHTLTLVPKFRNEDHSVRAMARVQLVSGNSSAQSNDVRRLPSGLTNTTAGGLVSGMSSSYGHWRALYYTFSTHYAYKGKYTAMFTLRADATTKFGPKSRWGLFPAISGRWNVIDEKFMEWPREHMQVSMFGLRLGWGRQGNQPGSDFLYLNKYNSGSPYLDQIAMVSSGIKLTEFHWENIFQWDGGVNLGFFDNRLEFVLDVYNRTTHDMLLPNYPIPSGTNGRTGLDVKNNGKMRNKGWEFSIIGHNLAKKGKFSMDVNVNFANNHNVILEMDPIVLEGYNTDFSESNAQLLQRVQLNNPFGSIYGFRSKGVYMYNYDGTSKSAMRIVKTQGLAALQASIDAGNTYPVALDQNGRIITNEKGEPLQMQFCYKSESGSKYVFKGGDAIYEDVNNDGNINQLDLVYLGNSLPKLTGGFGFRLHYDRFALNAQFNYRVDYDVFNMARLQMESMTTNDNQSQAVNYRWRKEGDVTTIPRAMYGGGTNYNTLVSDRFVEDASFLRLNYLQLSYNFDPKLLKKWHLRSLRVNANLDNLFCLTKYSGVDPEIGYGGYSVATDNSKTPRAKSYTFGLAIGF
ncbi:MAG: SusC/RagA family TonB-linked outer membrane protein [Bacteroidaceae bacterium]|nr:SusC/RagA family TonB-linked outer membrane protein [Bacteroidaceae bacterium]